MRSAKGASIAVKLMISEIMSADGLAKNRVKIYPIPVILAKF
jgi:hypothetical protein